MFCLIIKQNLNNLNLIIHSSPIQLFILPLFNYSFFIYSIIHSSLIQLFIFHLFTYSIQNFFKKNYFCYLPSPEVAEPLVLKIGQSDFLIPRKKLIQQRHFSKVEKSFFLKKIPDDSSGIYFLNLKKYFFLLRPF